MSIGDDNIGTGIGISAGGAGAGAASGISLPVIIAVMFVLATTFYLFMRHRAQIERRIHARNYRNRPTIHHD